MGSWTIWQHSILSVQFCHEPKTALKSKVYPSKKCTSPKNSNAREWYAMKIRVVLVPSSLFSRVFCRFSHISPVLLFISLQWYLLRQPNMKTGQERCQGYQQMLRSSCSRYSYFWVLLLFLLGTEVLVLIPPCPPFPRVRAYWCLLQTAERRKARKR